MRFLRRLKCLLGTSLLRWLMIGLLGAAVIFCVAVYFPSQLPVLVSIHWNVTCLNVVLGSVSSVEVKLNSIKPEFQQFLNLTSGVTSLPIFVLDKRLLGCINDNSQCGGFLGVSGVTFGAFPDSLQCLSQVSVLMSHGWTYSENHDQYLVYTKNNFSVIIAIVEIRQNYWYIPANPASPAAAVLSSNFTVVAINKVQVLAPVEPQYFIWQLDRSKFIECNQTIAQMFHESHPNISAATPLISDEQFLELVYLRDFMHTWRKDPFLFGGTLLGWYRECSLITYTTDLDVAVKATEWDKDFERALIKDQRLQMYWILGKPSDSLEMSVYASSVKIDIFYLYEEPTAAWVGGMIVGKKEKLRWSYPPLKGICSGDLKGHLFFVPCNVVEYLEADYGADWYAPVDADKFLWYKSHHNVRSNGHWSLSEWPSIYRTVFPKAIRPQPV